MKNLIVLIFAISLTSCFNYTHVVGTGAKGTQEVTEKNNYFIEGLVTAKTADPQKMADGSKDYTVHTRHTFADGLLWFITLGIYTPSTTTVTK